MNTFLQPSAASRRRRTAAVLHWDGLLRVLALTHAGMPVEDLREAVEAWLASAHHPRFGCRNVARPFLPMQELLGYLQAHGIPPLSRLSASAGASLTGNAVGTASSPLPRAAGSAARWP